MKLKAVSVLGVTLLLSLLTACGGGGSDDPSENTSPVANISISSNTNMEAPATIEFDASGSTDADGNVASYLWDFGDNFSSTDAIPSHTYTNAGDYTVILIVTDNEGATSSPATTTLNITEPPTNNAPVASFSYQPNSELIAPITINFNSSDSSDTDGDIVSYQWDFGDGINSTQAMPNHTYSIAGDYTVTLTVVDNDGATSELASTMITVANNSTHLPISIQSSITHVQPMTGIVLWEDSWNSHDIKTNSNIQLEYSYVAYNAIVTEENSYDWSVLDSLLERVAARGHQAIIRFYYSYPGRETTVPDYIKSLSNYAETLGTSEGLATWFPDWSQQTLETFHSDFYTALAERYDNDPRLAFLQIRFGLWGEYHIYDGPNNIGEQFPSKDYQTNFLTHLSSIFETLHWSLSIDAASDYYSPFAAAQDLLNLNFGNFDDSFMHENHSGYNADSWQFFSHQQRYQHSPHGGELSYYTDYDQQNALNEDGIHGRTYQELSAQYNISYMIGNDQPNYQSVARINEAGMANGYRFKVTQFTANQNQSIVTITNAGIAPIYYDAYVTINGTRANQSLKGLLPGENNTFTIPAGGDAPVLTIQSDRLVSGQEIQFEADL